MPSADSPALWENLTTAALLGSERTSDIALPSDELAPLLAGSAPHSREHLLLAAITAVDLYGRAGAMAPAYDKEISSAGPEMRPPVSRKSDNDLQVMLAGTHEDALAEWLEACAKAGKRPRERTLPRLLDRAAARMELRKRVQAIMGERGAWLLAQNSEWRNVFSPPAVDAWEMGTKDERLATLRALRTQNPGEARELLEKSWGQEGPDERARFIEVLADGLSMADEPFLEAALDDKRKEVREEAAKLLARLPESRLSLRMASRLGKLMSFKTKLLGKPKLEVRVPEEHTKELARDGIGSTSNVYGLGDKAFWRSQIIAATPIRFWTQTLKLDVAALGDALKKNEWAAATFRGLALAAARQCHSAFAQALLGHWAIELEDRDLHASSEVITRLVNGLPPEDREAALAPFLSGADKFLERDVLLLMLQGCGHPWSLEFSRKFLRLLVHYLDHERSSYTAMREVAATFAYRVHPGIAPELASRLEGHESTSALDQFVATVHFRHDMLKELSA